MQNVVIKNMDRMRNSIGQFVNVLGDLTELHQWQLIEAQDWITENWPTGPALSGITTGVKGSSTVMVDTAEMYRGLTTGFGAGTRNEATATHARIGIDHPGALANNFGAIIRPKNAKYLAIPLTKAAKKAGSPRRFGKPLDFIPLKKRDGYILVEAEPKRAKKAAGPVPRTRQPRQAKKFRQAQYLLVKEVRIPPRKVMPTIEDLKPVMLGVTIRYYEVQMQKAIK